ncbi:GNAT family N-acetyltransferase [Bacillus sp. S13(2024)]|uniref:GNAT family N-acetyltransferase n=1 Tax=unclassified Bacillus (in: firmicutes) TaxID=185979 RepID=UPI003D20345D
MSYIIRQMNSSDAEEVKKIAKITWQNAYGHILPLDIQEKTLEEAYSLETMQYRFDNSIMLVAQEERRIIGYAFFSKKQENGEALLESIYIHPNHQNKGIGSKLMQEGTRMLQPLNKLSLHVLKGNESSLLFYRSKGFQVEKEFNHKFREFPVTFIRMSLELKQLNK